MPPRGRATGWSGRSRREAAPPLSGAQANAWAPAKLGPLTADAVTLDAADISIEGKNFGNCTLVDLRTPAAQLSNADSEGSGNAT